MLYIVMCCVLLFFFFFFFNDTATTEIYTLSLLDALPIACAAPSCLRKQCGGQPPSAAAPHRQAACRTPRAPPRYRHGCPAPAGQPRRPRPATPSGPPPDRPRCRRD